MSDRPSKPAALGGSTDPDAPPSAEEVGASKRLRDALEDPSNLDAASEDLDLVKSLRAAWSPGPLDEGVHASMLDDLPISAEELRLAAELRDVLDGTRDASDAHDAHDANDVVVALRSAWSPTALGEDGHHRLVEDAIGAAPRDHDRDAKVVALKPRPVRVAVVTATTVIALAASVVVWITTAAPQAEAPLARARSTQPLFGEPFKPGETSAHIDRIAIARASDYRDNRFAKWGVR
jgi:hypothetical protein